MMMMMMVLLPALSMKTGSDKCKCDDFNLIIRSGSVERATRKFIGFPDDLL